MVTDEKKQPDETPAEDEGRKRVRAEIAQQRIAEAGPVATLPKREVKMRRAQFDSSYQNYLFGSSGTLEKPAWSDSTRGRAVIRMMSRGITGAAFFAIGGRIARMQLRNYDPHNVDTSKPLQILAKGFDVIFGEPIAWVAKNTVNTRGMSVAQKMIARENAAWDAVNFRNTTYNFSTPGRFDKLGRPMNGRSLGSEMVGVSFDFAMMSIGDAMTRNLVQIIDPNIRKTWMVNDDGKMAADGEKSHFSATKFAKAFGRATWRVLSKNQGEDWAVALPYVYQMKFQRNLLSRAVGGHMTGAKIMFDNGWNGAAYRVDATGKVIGDYQLLGALDLHTRFVGYNVLTLMFREGYDEIGARFNRWRDNHFSLHAKMPEHPVSGFFHEANRLGRYIVKSTIKANIYMNPAVIPFWLMRSPSTKWRGGIVHNEMPFCGNAMATKNSFEAHLEEAVAKHGFTNVAQAEKAMLVRDTYKNPVYNFETIGNRIFPGGPNGKGITQPATMFLHNSEVANPMHTAVNPYDPKLYEHYETKTAYDKVSKGFSKALNPLGQFSYWLGGKATSFSNRLPEGMVKKFIGVNEGNPLISNAAGRETTMRNFVDASLAYTPYFFAKTEFGLRVDDSKGPGHPGKMDAAIYSLMDNIVGLHWRSAGTSIKKIAYLSTHRDKLIMREGGVHTPETEEPTKVASTAVPGTTVHPEGRKHHDPIVELDRSEGAEKNDRSWAESVAGRNLAAQFQPDAPPTRH